MRVIVSRAGFCGPGEGRLVRGAVRVARLNCFDTANPHWSLPIPVSRCARQSRASHLIPAMSRKYPGSKLLIADTGGTVSDPSEQTLAVPGAAVSGCGGCCTTVDGESGGRVVPGYAGLCRV